MRNNASPPFLLVGDRNCTLNKNCIHAAQHAAQVPGTVPGADVEPHGTPVGLERVREPAQCCGRSQSGRPSGLRNPDPPAKPIRTPLNVTKSVSVSQLVNVRVCVSVCVRVCVYVVHVHQLKQSSGLPEETEPET